MRAVRLQPRRQTQSSVSDTETERAFNGWSYKVRSGLLAGRPLNAMGQEMVGFLRNGSIRWDMAQWIVKQFGRQGDGRAYHAFGPVAGPSCVIASGHVCLLCRLLSPGGGGCVGVD